MAFACVVLTSPRTNALRKLANTLRLSRILLSNVRVAYLCYEDFHETYWSTLWRGGAFTQVRQLKWFSTNFLLDFSFTTSFYTTFIRQEIQKSQISKKNCKTSIHVQCFSCITNRFKTIRVKSDYKWRNFLKFVNFQNCFSQVCEKTFSKLTYFGKSRSVTL